MQKQQEYNVYLFLKDFETAGENTTSWSRVADPQALHTAIYNAEEHGLASGITSILEQGNVAIHFNNPQITALGEKFLRAHE
ncbi:hypothetical protein [Kurthia huakuii]|uniref:hypothetical protein n=1 Tax=Kurthia huakuii TaxID=1421019 RepID=UPI000495E1D0|nr:hypothetical protein [Kurthia huakuii]MBM7699386.1 hypothetical protein [Kurthia huakuii]